MEVLVEQDQVTPVWIFLELLRASIDRALAALVTEEGARQTARELSYQSGQLPADQGFALVHNNIVYGDLTYGELAAAADGGNWVTVASGTSQTEANTIAQLLPLP